MNYEWSYWWVISLIKKKIRNQGNHISRSSEYINKINFFPWCNFRKRVFVEKRYLFNGLLLNKNTYNKKSIKIVGFIIYENIRD